RSTSRRSRTRSRTARSCQAPAGAHAASAAPFVAQRIDAVAGRRRSATPTAPQGRCKNAFTAGSKTGTRRMIPTTGGVYESRPFDMEEWRRGNYDSGEDFVLEYGELRFTFNEE